MSKPTAGITIPALPRVRQAAERLTLPCIPTYQAHVWSAARATSGSARRSRRLSARRAGGRTLSPSSGGARCARRRRRRSGRRGRPGGRRESRDDPHPLRRHLQAERTPRLRAGDGLRILDDLGGCGCPRSRGSRCRTSPTGSSPRARPEHDPQHVPSAPRDLPARDRPRRGHGQPCAGLTLPAVRGRRERIASPTEAAALIAALRPSRPRSVGNCPLRRPSPRRAAGAP